MLHQDWRSCPGRADFGARASSQGRQLAGGERPRRARACAQDGGRWRRGDPARRARGLEFAGKSRSAGNIKTLRAKLAAAPKDPQARFDLALALNAKGDRSGALDELLARVAENRAWKGDAARKQLLQLFDAWGASDASTIAGRQRLSSLPFS